MLAVLVALALLAAAVAGVYLLLKDMGQDGVEAAAPGSCKSGRCGVQTMGGAEAGDQMLPEQLVSINEIKRKGATQNDQGG